MIVEQIPKKKGKGFEVGVLSYRKEADASGALLVIIHIRDDGGLVQNGNGRISEIQIEYGHIMKAASTFTD